MPESGGGNAKQQVAPAKAGSLSDFAAQVLRGLGAPDSAANIAFLLAWFHREGVNPAYNNPLATTLKYGSYTDINSVGVKHYADQATGVQATIRTLQKYTGIVADLKQNNANGAAHNHPDEFKRWSGGGYDHIDIGSVGETLGGPAVATAASTTGGTGAPAPGALPANATPQQIEQFVRDNYPQAAGYLSVPEVRDILIQAARDDAAGAPWSQEKLQAKIQASNWYRNTGQAARQFQLLQQTDPATAEAQIQQKMADLRPDFTQLGSDVSLHAIAEAALKYGWDDAQIKENFVGHLEFDHKNGGIAKGSAVAVESETLANIARNEYFVPMSAYDTEQWAIDIYAGKKTEDQYRSYLSDIADARFPGLKAEGITPGQYLAPIRNVIADTLELQPGDVDLLNRQYSGVLQVPGENRPMTISEAQQWARSQKAYQYTKGAKDEAASFAESIGQRFGVVA